MLPTAQAGHSHPAWLARAAGEGPPWDGPAFNPSDLKPAHAARETVAGTEVCAAQATQLELVNWLELRGLHL